MSILKRIGFLVFGLYAMSFYYCDAYTVRVVNKRGPNVVLKIKSVRYAGFNVFNLYHDESWDCTIYPNSKADKEITGISRLMSITFDVCKNDSNKTVTKTYNQFSLTSSKLVVGSRTLIITNDEADLKEGVKTDIDEALGFGFSLRYGVIDYLV